MKTLVILVLSLLASSCATIINGTTQKIPVNSVPSGARVIIGETTVYKTPTVIDLPRKENHTLQFELEGYETETVKVESVTSGAVMGNLDRKSTRLNSSHGYISYAVFCLKKK